MLQARPICVILTMEHEISSISIFCLLLLCFGVASAQVCSETSGSFRPNTTYDTNRRLVLSSLPSSAAARDDFYNASAAGQDPNRVYAMAMCMPLPGTKAEDCSECIKTTSEEVMQSCPNQTEAFWWSAGDTTRCLVHYANRSFVGTANLEPSEIVINDGNITGNTTEFDGIWEGLMIRVITAASSDTRARKYFAADVADWTGFQRIYALMQCTLDLSPADCGDCLRESVRSYQGCCQGKRGGVVRRPSCFFRWDMYPFLGAFDNTAASPPPTQQPTSQGDGANTTRKDSGTISSGTIVAIVVPIFVIILVLVALGLVVHRRRKSYQNVDLQTDADIATSSSLQFEFRIIEVATNKFSSDNLLGHGGFGEVYKGTLANGTEVAVKRLSKTSGQGEREFKTEAVLVAKLQHRSLVRLLGFCVKGEEKILVYEFVPNKSLDYFLSDPTKKCQLDWTRRHNIIGGIARGILYLHQDSRLTIIHRDLKASNILLDADMNPKIADFGMAKIFGVDQTRADTSRIVGTYGYMSPEYAMHGQFSMKSDVYSFGIIVLEIISGSLNSSYNEPDGSSGSLVTHAWGLWRNGSPLEFVDPTIGETYQSNEVTRCIHIGLLCVQEDPADRPTMSTVILMLTSDTITLPVPRQPGFFFHRRPELDSVSSSRGVESGTQSVNEVSITEFDPR